MATDSSSRLDSICVQMTVVLAWAATHKLDFGQALSTMQPRRWPFLGLMNTLLMTTHGNRRHVVAVEQIDGVVRDLNDGRDLSDALERRMRRHLPPYYLEAVREAETNGTLDVMLPILAKRTRAWARSSAIFLPAITYVVCYLVIGGTLFSGLMIFIIPKFATIFSEMMSGAPLPQLTATIMRVSASMIDHFELLFLTLGVIVANAWLPFGLRLSSGIGERLLLAMPLLGRLHRRLHIFEAAQAMAVSLEAHRDIVEATEWAAAASRSGWLTRRLEHAADRLRDGVRWDAAWREAKLQLPMLDWILANSATRQIPAAGFALVADTTGDDLASSLRMLAKWTEPLFVIATAVVVGSVVVALFLPLMTLVSMMSQ